MADEIKQVEERLIQWRKIAQSWMHSRKALIFLVTFTIANVALFLKLLNGDQWITIIKWTVASYMGANVADGVSDAISGKGIDQ